MPFLADLWAIWLIASTEAMIQFQRADGPRRGYSRYWLFFVLLIPLTGLEADRSLSQTSANPSENTPNKDLREQRDLLWKNALDLAEQEKHSEAASIGVTVLHTLPC